MSKLHTYHFPFLSNELKIEFVENINPNLAEAITDLIFILKNDLSSSVSNSSGHKLNSSGLKFPVIVSPDFLEFFEVNLKYFFATQSDFNPFNIEVDLNNITNYYFNYVDVAGSFGKVTWNAKFNLVDYNTEVDFTLHNKFAYIFIPDINKVEKAYAKFANIDKEIKPLFIILKGNNLLDLRILSLEIENLRWKHQFITFAQENNVQLVIYNQDKEKIEI